jgi:hypothetical protein
MFVMGNPKTSANGCFAIAQFYTRFALVAYGGNYDFQQEIAWEISLIQESALSVKRRVR